MRNRRDATIYWTLTALFLIPSAGTAAPELLMRPPENILKTNEALGYPLYLFAILGLAKLLGTGVILAGGRFPTLKEWAYAGFAFEYLGAAASHVLAGDPSGAPLPLAFFAVLMGSYYYWHKTKPAAASPDPHGAIRDTQARQTLRREVSVDRSPAAAQKQTTSVGTRETT